MINIYGETALQVISAHNPTKKEEVAQVKINEIS